jgi:hypothetical protein
MHERFLDVLEALAPSLQSTELVQVARVLLPILEQGDLTERESTVATSRPRPRDPKRPKVIAARRRRANARPAANGHAAPNGKGDRVESAINFLRQALQKGPAPASEVE